jgi:hypothetical protein
MFSQPGRLRICGWDLAVEVKTLLVLLLVVVVVLMVR